jgi:uncharacterized protein
MRRLFADTSYYIALVNGADEHHAAAVQHSRSGPAVLITHGLVIVELANELSDPRNRRLFVDLHHELCNDSRSIIVPADAALIDRGIDLYRRRLDKAWSLTDCVSYIVMNDEQLQEALTADHHFEQAGYRALLRTG